MAQRNHNRAVRRLGWTGLLSTAIAALVAWCHAPAMAATVHGPSGPTPSKDQPITFTADAVEYDRERSLVIARGHVEAWQGGRVLRADQLTFDRSSGVVVAIGNIAILEPDGQVVFAQYAELSRDMSTGLLKDIRVRMDQNGKLAANGMRRSGGAINELSKVVYSSCDLCKDDPTRPLLWQIEAATATQDTEHKTIEYHDAVLKMGGIPVAEVPFIWHPDPSVPRQSGLMPPLLGNSSRLGVFYGQPYYWVIDGQSDATITPLLSSRQGGMLDTQYRQRFNSGTLLVNASAGYDSGSPQGSIGLRGQFAIDDTWRWGFDINRASSSQFVSSQHLLLGLAGDSNVLPTTVYLEGFGQGSYSRLDMKAYQALTTSISSGKLPLALPRYLYSYTGTPDALGGRFSLDAGAFNVLRTDGTNTRRTNLSMQWERPYTGAFGDLWKVTLHGDSAAYDASSFQEQPNFGPRHNVDTAHAQPGIAIDFRWPWMRESGKWGTQLIEPIVQIVAQPRGGDSQIRRIPNEDSLGFDFTDANLFGFNRFNGLDRLEGGTRLNAALHGTWWVDGPLLDVLVGQSYQTSKDNMFPQLSGLHDQVSDVVARATVTPTRWLDMTYRTRLDKSTGQIRMADASSSVGTDRLRITGGYLYSTFDPYYFYDQTLTAPPPANSPYYIPRNEVNLTVSSKWDRYRASAYMRRNLATNQMVAYGGVLSYEDECFILDVRFIRRFTSIANDNGSTALLFFFTFKTVGQIGYRAI
jgi:LPS-assembly protein